MLRLDGLHWGSLEHQTAGYLCRLTAIKTWQNVPALLELSHVAPQATATCRLEKIAYAPEATTGTSGGGGGGALAARMAGSSRASTGKSNGRERPLAVGRRTGSWVIGDNRELQSGALWHRLPHCLWYSWGHPDSQDSRRC